MPPNEIHINENRVHNNIRTIKWVHDVWPNNFPLAKDEHDESAVLRTTFKRLVTLHRYPPPMIENLSCFICRYIQTKQPTSKHLTSKCMVFAVVNRFSYCKRQQNLLKTKKFWIQCLCAYRELFCTMQIQKSCAKHCTQFLEQRAYFI